MPVFPAPATAIVAPSLIGFISYNPVSLQSVSITSGTYIDLDATNLAVTFTTPLSGKVLVRLNGHAVVASNCGLGWTLREGSTDVGPGREVLYASANQINVDVASTFLIIGLIPGSVHTYKWGVARLANPQTAVTQYGAGLVASMEVWDANPTYSQQLMTGVRPFKKTVWKNASNYTTTSASLVDIDAVNVPALSLSLSIGDVIQLSLSLSCYTTVHANVIGFDWLVDRPVSADITIGALTSDWAAYFHDQNGASFAVAVNAKRTFVCTEAGLHTFKPQYKVTGGTLTILQTGTYHRAIEHMIVNMGLSA